MSTDPDYLLALDLHRRFNETSDENDSPEVVDFKMPPPSRQPLQLIKRSNPHSNLDPEFLNRTQNLVHPQWETLDPTPDVFALFSAFDSKFFQGRLKCVSLEWSKRMYSCAGICYMRKNRFGKDITIRLSEPLLKLRPRKDLVETMLHEMIHAYCFALNIREGNGGHGPNFKKIMNGINKVAGTNITVYHTFNDEVELYKQHWWRCNGSCQNRSPFFGYVKRTSNRAPGPNDQWWSSHMESCGGTFMKIKSPDNKKDKPHKTKKEKNVKDHNAGTDLRNFFPTTSGKKSTSNGALNNVNGLTNSSGYKGPIKMNGGGTMVLNPKNKYPAATIKSPVSSIATIFPPTSYPGLSSDPFKTNGHGSINRTTSAIIPGGNLSNVVGFRDLNSTTKNSTTPTFATAGSGHTLTPDTTKEALSRASSDGQIDRNHLRDLWSNRFGNAGRSNSNVSNSNGSSPVKKTAELDVLTETGDAKRRRISSPESLILITDDIHNKESNSDAGKDWIFIDDDIMFKDKPEEVIALSSGSDNDSDDSDAKQRPLQKPIKLSANERQTAIKKEIIDGNTDETLTDEDIILIDDDYDDDEAVLNSAVAELADTSLIEDLFGEDTLLKEFKQENDVVPSGSRHVPKPEDDIITCPICQGKMKRSQLSEHLDGCTGIAIKIQPPKFTPKNLPKTSKALKPSRRPRKSKKDILYEAGYTEEDLVNITSSSTDEESSLNLTQDTRISSPTKPIEVLDLDSSGEFPRRHRQRNLFKTTRQCPVCAQEIEEDMINDHLDDCLN